MWCGYIGLPVHICVNNRDRSVWEEYHMGNTTVLLSLSNNDGRWNWKRFVAAHFLGAGKSTL